MSAQQSRFEQILEKYGTEAIHYARHEFNGAPLAVVDTGGGIPAGTYFYRVCPIVEDEEKATNKMTKVIVADGGKVNLSWTIVSLASSYKVYRSVNPNFPSPSFIGNSSSNSYIDEAAYASEGSPPESYGSPFIWYSSSGIKILPLSGRFDQEATSKGIVSIEKRVAFASGNLSINVLDKVEVNEVEYEVFAVQPYFLANIPIYKRIVLTRLI
ncbi:MAG: hypothetical protein QXJ68_08420 [Methanocellales archaeon]